METRLRRRSSKYMVTIVLQYFRYLKKRKTFVFLLEVVRSRNLCQDYTKN